MRRKSIPTWRVYAAKHPSDLNGEKYSCATQSWRTGGWFWIKKSTQVNLWIRVRGLDNARWVCRRLNRYAGQVAWRKRNPEKLHSYSVSQARRQRDELRGKYIRRQHKALKNKISMKRLKQRIQIRRARKLLLPLAIAGKIAQSCK